MRSLGVSLARGHLLEQRLELVDKLLQVLFAAVRTCAHPSRANVKSVNVC